MFEQWFATGASVRRAPTRLNVRVVDLPQRHSDDHAFVLTSYKT